MDWVLEKQSVFVCFMHIFFTLAPPQNDAGATTAWVKSQEKTIKSGKLHESTISIVL